MVNLQLENMMEDIEKICSLVYEFPYDKAIKQEGNKGKYYVLYLYINLRLVDFLFN